MRTIAVSSSPATGEYLFFKNRVGKAKSWLVLIVTLFGVLKHATYARRAPSELTGTTLVFETGGLRSLDIHQGCIKTLLSTAHEHDIAAQKQLLFEGSERWQIAKPVEDIPLGY